MAVSESCVGRKLLSLGQVVDQVSQLCEVEMDVCKDSLLLRDVCDSSTVYQVIHPHSARDQSCVHYMAYCRY